VRGGRVRAGRAPVGRSCGSARAFGPLRTAAACTPRAGGAAPTTRAVPTCTPYSPAMDLCTSQSTAATLTMPVERQAQPKPTAHGHVFSQQVGQLQCAPGLQRLAGGSDTRAATHP
jgi:hypothetical protein